MSLTVLTRDALWHNVHVVFTLPRELAPLALQNRGLIDNLLFRASAATLLEIARDSRHLGAEIGFFSVLPTWDSDCNIILTFTAYWPPAATLSWFSEHANGRRS